MHTNSGHTYTQTLAGAISVTHVHTETYTQAHIPHGVGNMSEQSIIWHLNQSLLLEVWRNAAGKIYLDDKQLGDSFPSLDCMKVKETYIFPKHWLVHVECLHCAALYIGIVVPCFHRRLYEICKDILRSKAFLPWLLFRCCAVTVKATGKQVALKDTQNKSAHVIAKNKIKYRAFGRGEI